MKRQGRRFLYFVLCSVGVSVIILGVLIGTFVFRPFGSAGAASAGSVLQAMPPNGGITPMRPMWNMATKMGANAQGAIIPCLANNALPKCYSPQQIRQAYGAQQLLNAGINGKGRTITIIDAFQDPTVRTDLRLFDRLFGLPDPQLNIIAPFGLTRFNPKDPAQTGFAGEIALDVEWAHAMAPGATIDLVLANVKHETLQGQLTALMQAARFVVQNNIGSVISMSFGTSENCLGTAFIQNAHRIFQQARAQRQTVFASAGDNGAAVVQCNGKGQPVTLARGVNYPASDPLISGVGGTTLMAGPNGTYMNEIAWNESQKGAGATGGGVSKVFALPIFQRNLVQSKTRGVDDVSFDADPLTGVPIVTSSLMPGATLIIPIGGTSLGAPAMAGLTALFDQASGNMRLGFLNGAFYRISQNAAAYAQGLHDIKTGNNTFVFQLGNGNIVTVPGFNAVAGWDPPTGVGTPNAANLAKLLPQFIRSDDGSSL